MKKYILLSFCISFCASVFSQGNIDVLHYHFNIGVSDNNDSLHGAAIIKFIIREKKPAIQFDLTGVDKKGKGMLVTLTGYKGKGSDNNFKQENDKLIIPCSLNAGDTGEIIINYKGIPADGLIISKNKYGHRTFFSDNWPNRAHNWIPCVDEPADKASVEFSVSAPEHYTVISNGIKTGEDKMPGNMKLTHYKEEVQLPTKVMVIGVADFAVDDAGTINNVPVYSWVFPENKKEGFGDYAPAKDILGFYMNYIGAYPYKKLANVQSKTIFGGMENAGAIFYFENSVNGKKEQETLLAHEIVHQWFGDMATEKNFAHLWLSEGFATYLTHVYIETKYGKDSLEKRMRKEREEIIDFVSVNHRPVVDTTSDYMQLLNANSYQKGGWILHMLRRQLGDSVFHKSIRDYYAMYAGKNADTKDLQKIFETVSGKNLEHFFNQWLYSPVNPKLKLKWKWLPRTKKVQLDIEQQQDGILFTLPMDIELTVGTKKMILPLLIDSKTQHFTWTVAKKPSSVKADPGTSLLFEGTVTEVK